jgi:hypothetical protein
VTSDPDPAPRASEDPGDRPEANPLPRARAERSFGGIAAAGWPDAAGWGAVSFLVVAAAGQLVALALGLSGVGGSLATSARIGWLITCLFHHIPTQVEASASASGASGAPAATGIVAAALLTGTAGAAGVLFVAGRRTADRAGGDTLARMLHGAKVAPVYALALFLVSTLVEVRVAVPANPFVGDLSISPSPVGAFAWPLVLAAAAGAAGGRRSALEAGGDDRGGGGGLLAGVLTGGWRMLLLGLGFALGGLIVLAVAQPDATAAYARSVIRSGPGDATVIVAAQALSLPNHAIFTLVPAMGGCDGVYGEGVRLDAICLHRVPRELSLELFTPESGPRPEIDDAPRAFLILLLVPAAATTLGGAAAVRRARDEARGEARGRAREWSGPERAGIGAGAGVVFAVLVAAASALAGIRVSGELFGGAATGSIVYGPDPLRAGILALGWGIPGGAIGGLLAGRRPSRRPSGSGAVAG